MVVLEARDRVGGRILNHHIGYGGKVAEAGGEFVGPTQDHIVALAKEVGVKTFVAYDTGNNVYVNNGLRLTYADTGPLGTAPPDPLLLADIVKLSQQIDLLAADVPVDAPWTVKGAAHYDAQTLETWVRANAINANGILAILAPFTEALVGAEPHDLSFLFVLGYVAAAGNAHNKGTFERLFNVRNGAQMSRLVGGSQLVAQRVAKHLGGRVHLGTPVHRIEHTHAGVTVESRHLTVHAKHDLPHAFAGAHVVRIVAAHQHARRADRRDQEFELRLRVQDGVVVEAVDPWLRRLLDVTFGSGRTCQPCAQRPAWYGTKPPPCTRQTLSFGCRSSTPPNTRHAAAIVVSSGLPIRLLR